MSISLRGPFALLVLFLTALALSGSAAFALADNETAKDEKAKAAAPAAEKEAASDAEKSDETAEEPAEVKDRFALPDGGVDELLAFIKEIEAFRPTNVKDYMKNYEKYHDHGFDVVGVSIDQNREALEKYLEEEQVHWITLHEAEQGGKNPATTYYGITGIPTMILVGRDGNVLSTRARGAELNRLLAEQFPDVQAADEAEAETPFDAAPAAAPAAAASS